MIKPIGSKIVVRQVQSEPTSTILVVESTKTTIDAEVLALGTSDDFEVSVGDVVIISSSVGQRVTIDSEELIVITQDNILAVK